MSCSCVYDSRLNPECNLVRCSEIPIGKILAKSTESPQSQLKMCVFSVFSPCLMKAKGAILSIGKLGCKRQRVGSLGVRVWCLAFGSDGMLKKSGLRHL